LYFLSSLTIGLIAGLKYKIKAGIALVAFSWLWASYSIWRFIVIVFKTKNVFDLSTGTTAWKTFDAYLYDPVTRLGQVAMLILAGIFLRVAMKRQAKS
jgi:hypothetical protein